MELSNNRALLITLSNIGDVIMTTPVLQALHEYFPEACIDIVADSRSADIFKYCPFRGDLFLKHKRGLFRGAWALLNALRERQYDLIVDLRTDGFAYLLRGSKRLTKWHKRNSVQHSVEQHMSVIRSIWNDKPVPSCRIWLDDVERLYANETLGAFKGKMLLGLGPGANFHKKIWSADRFVQLTDRLCDRYDAVVVFGGERDRPHAEYVSSNTSLHCINLCEKTALLQAAAVLEHVDLYVGNDSGLGHMASAMGKPTMTIFGTGEPARYRPWGSKAMLVVGKNQDINNVTVDDVMQALGKEYFCVV